MKKLNEALQKALDLSLEPVSIELLRTLFSEMKSFRSEELLRSLQDQINFNLKENILVFCFVLIFYLFLFCFFFEMNFIQLFLIKKK